MVGPLRVGDILRSQYGAAGRFYSWRTFTQALIAISLLSIAFIAAPGSAAADSLADKGDHFLRQAASQKNGPEWVSVIVRMDKPLDDSRELKLKGIGSKIIRRLNLVNGAAIKVQRNKLKH